VRKSSNFCFNFGEWGVTALNSKTLKLRKIYILFWGCGIRCEVRFPILELDKYKRIFSQSHLKEMLKIHEKSVFKLLFDQGMESNWCWSSCQFCKVKFRISVDNSTDDNEFLVWSLIVMVVADKSLCLTFSVHFYDTIVKLRTQEVVNRQ
jgi:hypothetical protein